MSWPCVSLAEELAKGDIGVALLCELLVGGGSGDDLLCCGRDVELVGRGYGNKK